MHRASCGLTYSNKYPCYEMKLDFPPSTSSMKTKPQNKLLFSQPLTMFLHVAIYLQCRSQSEMEEPQRIP